MNERTQQSLKLLELVEKRIEDESKIYNDPTVSISRREDALTYATTLQGILIASESRKTKGEERST